MHPVTLKHLWRQFVAAHLIVAFALPISLYAANDPAEPDRTAMATSALEYGGSLGSLLWVATRDQARISESTDKEYELLARRVKEQIDLGRASSSLLKANFNVIGTTLSYAAITDPEPLSKGITGVAAWGAKKTGDLLGEAVMEKSQEQATAILARGLQNANLTTDQLKSMSPDDLRAKVADLQVGGKTLRDILADNPKSLSMLQANASDIAQHLGVEAIARAQAAADDANSVKTGLARTQKQLDDFQAEVSTHLDKVDKAIGGLQTATYNANQKLDALKLQVQGNTLAIRAVAAISYSGWTTSQKLQAVESGLFPGLTDTDRKALTESLQADKARETLISNVQEASRDFGNLAEIAGRIGLPKELVTGLQGAQIAASAVANFASGNYLGAVAGLTSLVGLGGPDAEALRFAQLMGYLHQEFKAVNIKLDHIIELQVKTLEAVAALAEEQRTFRVEVLGQLDVIQTSVLENKHLLQALLLNEWTTCDALITGAALNGEFAIPNRDVLLGVLSDINIDSNASTCYSTMSNFFNTKVKAARWSGQIIAAQAFPADAITPDIAAEKSWAAFQAQQNDSFTSARDFLLMALSGTEKTPVPALVRLAQPVVNVRYQEKLILALGNDEVSKKLKTFTCDHNDILSPALKDLTCFGIQENVKRAPLPSRWNELLQAPLLGPQAGRLIDTGITLSTIVDFSKKNHGALSFVDPASVKSFPTTGSTTDLMSALGERKGVGLLAQLEWLAQAVALQESIAYGDYTAQLAEAALYDPATRSLSEDPKTQTPLQKQAVLAMRLNPILARNVVLVAMRHSLADAMGGRGKAEEKSFNKTFYNLGLMDFAGSQACGDTTLPREKLASLFPKWQFGYWVTDEQVKADAALTKCPRVPMPDATSPHLPLGSGPALKFAGFYILLPTPMVLAEGMFEQADSLRIALMYQDRVRQALIDRGVAGTVRSIASSPKQAEQVSFELLNEGWNWKTRNLSEPNAIR